MKKLVFIAAFYLFISTAVMANVSHTSDAAKDTVRKQKKPVQPHVVHGRAARMRLQQQQIKRHKKEWKKADSVQKELDKETHKSN
jgi:hypothetical protein